ncbi:MAG: glucokinase [Rhodospirillales bacterium]
MPHSANPADPPAAAPLGLVGDIGGTNCRLALVDWQAGRPSVRAFESMLCADHATAADCIGRWLGAQGPGPRPRFAVFAVAGPVLDGAASLTNNDWQLCEAALAAELGLSRVRLINDFAALALATPHLEPADSVPIGPDLPGRAGATIAVMGPGTGFGLAALAGGTSAGLLVTEGGHIAYAPTDEVEHAVLRILARRHGRVSIERILAGLGLADLHAALEDIAGTLPTGLDAASITAAAAAGNLLAGTTVDRFCAILGSTAGDLALALGAQGGVFIAGGIAPRLLDALRASPFRHRFETKGRCTHYMQSIPTRVITTKNAALRGAAHELARLAGLEPI